MPVYEYACGKCGHELEAEQRITEPPLKTCPRCRARKLKRLISQTSFVLKGSGWYSDLYSSKAKPESADAKPDAAAPKSEAASDSAPAAAPSGSDAGSDAAPPSDPKPKKKREGKPGKSKGSKAAA
jgi:putative FmdB family regulatory protein